MSASSCVCVCVCVCNLLSHVQLFVNPWTVCSPLAHSAHQNSSVHGILQARILEWVAIPFSKGSSQPRDQTQVSCLAGGFFTIWATSEAQLDNTLVSKGQSRHWMKMLTGEILKVSTAKTGRLAYLLYEQAWKITRLLHWTVLIPRAVPKLWDGN